MGAPPSRRRTRSLYRREAFRQGLLPVLPVVLIIAAVKGYPIILTVLKSFTNWDGVDSRFIGLWNYLRLFQSQSFWIMLRNNLVLLLHIPLLLLFGFILALVLHGRIPGWRFYRSVLYLPQVISVVIIGYVFRALFAYDGSVNRLLAAIGLRGLAIEWLGSGYPALFVIILSMVYQSLGWEILLIFGGLASIPESIMEAAELDGAGYWTRLFKVIVPLLEQVVRYSVIVSVMWVFTGLFPFIYTITRGGPGYETTTLDFSIYQQAFSSGSRLGAASATAVVLLAVVLLLTRVQMAVADRLTDWEGKR
jgi:multiple sugar transport system permease protein